MPEGKSFIRDALAELGIRSPRDLALWARERDLADVYVSFARAQGGLPACWQIVRPGHSTGVGAAWQRGNKTFTLISIAEKNKKEELASAWATEHFGPVHWVRIEGFDLALFPLSVAEELHRRLPGLIISPRTNKFRGRVTPAD